MTPQTPVTVSPASPCSHAAGWVPSAMMSPSMNCGENPQKKHAPARLASHLVCLGVVALAVLLPSAAWATNYIKKDTTGLTATTDWVIGVVPTSTDIGEFDSTISSTSEAALTLGAAWSVGGLKFDGTLNGPVTVSGTPTLTLGNSTLGAASGVDMSAANANVTIGCPVKFNDTLTVNVASGKSLLFGTATATNAPTLVTAKTYTFTGADTSANINLNIVSSISGALLKITGGTVTTSAGRNVKENLEIDGGTLALSPSVDRLSLTQSGQTFVMTGGTLNIPSTANYGLRLAGDNGPSGGGQAASWTGTQSGGTINIYKGGSSGFGLGGNGNVTGSATYTLSGTGILNDIGTSGNGTFCLGADSTLAYTTTFNLQGGKLIVSGNSTSSGNTCISGNTAAAKQVFAWTGGTLVCGSYVAANLQSVAGGAFGTLNNGGGTLAPGDVGSSGKTIITGNYSVGSAAASLAIDLGGITASSAFQDAANSGKFDLVAVSGTATLAGSLNVDLIGGFTPVSANTFKILTTAASGRSGTFNNVYNGRVTVAGTSGSSLTVAYNSADVTLGSYAALFAAWTVANATAPAGSTVTFTDNGSVGAITNWIVDFGDGSTKYTNSVSPGGTLSGVNTTHVYAAGNYTATLTVVASDGSTAQTTQAITASASSATLTWTGDGSANLWNTSPANLDWLNGATPAAYADGDVAVLDETGSTNPAVNLNSSVQPSTMAFSNSVTTYTLQGTGKITGSAQLTKNLAGTAIILTANDYSGGTTINGGILQVGNGTASGALGSGGIADNAALVFDPAGAQTVNNAITGSGAVTVQNAAVTLGGANGYNGGTTVTTGGTVVIAADNNLGASGSGLTLDNGTLQVTAAPLTLSHPLTVNAGGATLNLAGTVTTAQNNTGSGTVTVSAGTLQIGSAGTAGAVAGNISLAGGNLTYSRTDTLTPAGTIAGSSTGSSVTNASTSGGNTNTLTFADGNNLFGNILNSSAGSLVVTGSVNSTNTLGGTPGLAYAGNAGLTVSGGTFIVTNADVTGSSAGTSSGTLTLNTGATVNAAYVNGANGGSRHFKGNLTLNGGTFHVSSGRLGMDDSSGTQTLTLNSGSLTVDNISGGSFYGLRLGCDSGPASANTSIAATQSGGTATVAGGPGCQLGGTTGSHISTYTLSGGLLQVTAGGALTLGADTNGTSTTRFSLSGTGKALVSGTVSGAQTTGAPQQIFDFSGGTLVAATVNAAWLSSAAAPTTYGMLVNNGGTLAPGDVGTPGETVVIGNYNIASSSAVLAIDIGGAYQANAFQNGTTNYDYLLVNGSATLNGALTMNFVNGYQPSATTTYTVLTATNGVSGAFSATNLPALPAGYTWQVVQTITNVSLMAVAPLQAGNATYTRTVGLNLMISITNLLSNVTGGPVGGVNSLWSAGPSTNGATIYTNATAILYANASNLTDQFPYVVTNTAGLTATGYVTVLVNSSVTGTNSITAIVAGNPTSLTAYGIPGYSYITERATNLAPAVWIDIATNTAATNGVISVTDYFTDLSSNAPSSAFYQLKWQP